TGAVKRSRQRPRLQVEALEDRITPIIAVLVGSSLDVTSMAIALPPPTAAPQVALFCDGSVRLASGGAEQEVPFMLEDVASLNVPHGQGETSIKFDFDQAVPLTLAGATESAEIKGDAVVSLKLDGATAIPSIKFRDVLSLKLDGAPAEGDLTIHGDVGFTDSDGFPKILSSVSFDEAAGLTMNQDGVTSDGSGGGAGKVKFADVWGSAVMGDAISLNYTKRADLTVDDAPVLTDMEKWDITPAAPAAGTTSPSSLMLDGMESLTLNFTPASEATANMEYRNQWGAAGGLTSFKYDHALTLLDGPTAMATHEAHLQAMGAVTSLHQ